MFVKEMQLELNGLNIGWAYIGGLVQLFWEGCPTKPYATIPKGIMGNGGSWSLIEALGVSTTERNSTNKFIYTYSFLVGKKGEP